MFAWDPDFTKLTTSEKERLENIQNNSEYINMDLETLADDKAFV